jgi:hypothetical protein
MKRTVRLASLPLHRQKLDTLQEVIGACTEVKRSFVALLRAPSMWQHLLGLAVDRRRASTGESPRYARTMPAPDMARHTGWTALASGLRSMASSRSQDDRRQEVVAVWQLGDPEAPLPRAPNPLGLELSAPGAPRSRRWVRLLPRAAGPW